MIKINQQKVAENQKSERIAEIDDRLRNIDAESARPMRAILNESAVQYDRDRLAELNAEAETLRQERGILL